MFLEVIGNSMDLTIDATSGGVVVLLFLVSILLCLALMTWLGWNREEMRGSLCPYTRAKMRLGTDVAKSMQIHVNSFFNDLDPKDNPPIDFSKAAISDETGRIFTDCIVGRERIRLDWSFLQKRFPGTYVSWGALPENEKAIFRLLHSDIDGFQTDQSCPKVRPEDVDREYSLISPGPLYADRMKKILVGWKKVPGTYFEVLVVQRPKFQSVDETL